MNLTTHLGTVPTEHHHAPLGPSRRSGSVLLLTLFLIGAAPAARKLPPVDQAAQDPTFLAFRSQLLDTVAKRDGQELMKIVPEDIHMSFGPTSGRTAFIEQWNPDSKDSPLWDELAAVLKLGGTFLKKDEFCAPYTFTNFPDDLDPFFHVVVIAADVPLRSAPNPEAPVVAKLSYEMLKAEPGSLDEVDWVVVERLNSPLKGFVARQSVRSPISYRAAFKNLQGRWILSYFIAGD